MNKNYRSRNVKRAIATVIAGVALTLATTAAPALASYQSWAG